MRPVIEMVKHGQTVHFTPAHRGQLWYATADGEALPIPVNATETEIWPAQAADPRFLSYLHPHHALVRQARHHQETVS